ncbi:hypothetical protein DQ04_00071120 [Trypanosoma grayi]|uniref:hypothetical protein n=1 Tax=Trypanosoma grayi TaxID=71804 RepID=UPI0004F468B7|nr:hypothetical protein DQ04_00071120 [Trypanosoma grayi]KEG15444.1 hypothetical protein DQ04_00071120 [Trypanosoma grayi]
MQYLRSLFLTPDEALSRERVRNEIALENLAKARLQLRSEEDRLEKEVAELDNELQAKRSALAAVARPMLNEFDEVSLAQHYYQEVSNIAASHLRIVSQLADRELGEFGYVSKKLISVGLNYEVLKLRMASGGPFRSELSTVLKDAESDDLTLIAAPLQRVMNIPPAAAVRATAFDLARAIEEAGKGPAREPVRGWLDFLKFRTSFSPTMLEMRQVRARRAAARFLGHVEQGEYHLAMGVAEEIYTEARREVVANEALLTIAFEAFRNNVLPNIASDVFSRYARASLDASRYACVEKMLKE